MKYCDECGAQLEDNAVFCDECGTVNKEAPPLSQEIQPQVQPNAMANPNATANKAKNATIAVALLLLVAAGGTFAYFSGFFAPKGDGRTASTAPSETPQVSEVAGISEAPLVSETPSASEAPAAETASEGTPNPENDGAVPVDALAIQEEPETPSPTPTLASKAPKTKPFKKKSVSGLKFVDLVQNPFGDGESIGVRWKKVKGADGYKLDLSYLNSYNRKWETY